MEGLLTVRKLTEGYKLECTATGNSIRLDINGRWSSYRQGKQFYRRCIDGSVVQGAAALPVGKDRIVQLYSEARRWLEGLMVHPEIRSNHQCRNTVHKACAYSAVDYLNISQRYLEVYPESVPILPPDRYRDVVIQPALGCPNRHCTFCAFYKDKPYAVMQPRNFEQHLQGVIELLGMPMIAARGGCFLGSANALALSQRRILGYLEIINNRLGSFKRGIAAFADPDYAPPRTRKDWQVLAEYNVQRVVIGLETGWGGLRAQLGKSGNLTKVFKAIGNIKYAGIPVGLTVLTGACAGADVPEHHQKTCSFLQTLPLDSGDIIYISQLNKGLQELNTESDEKIALARLLKDNVPAKVVLYQMQRFHYYA